MKGVVWRCFRLKNSLKKSGRYLCSKFKIEVKRRSGRYFRARKALLKEHWIPTKFLLQIKLQDENSVNVELCDISGIWGKILLGTFEVNSCNRLIWRIFWHVWRTRIYKEGLCDILESKWYFFGLSFDWKQAKSGSLENVELCDICEQAVNWKWTTRAGGYFERTSGTFEIKRWFHWSWL